MEIDRHMWLWHDLMVRPTEWGIDGELPELTGPDRWAEGMEARMNESQRAAWDAAYGPRNAAFAEAVRNGELKGEAFVRWKYQRYIKNYLRCIAAVDKSVGQLVSWLEENDLDENTIVVYTSDQGFYLGEHGLVRQALDVRAEFAATPRRALARADRRRRGRQTPRAKPGLRSDVLGCGRPDARPRDAGLEPPADFRRRGPGTRGVAATPSTTATLKWESTPCPSNTVVRTDRHKLIYYHGLDQWELFDLDEDPDEMRNLIDDPALAERVRRAQTGA